MRVVLDASVELKWVLIEPNVDKALELRQEFQIGIHEFLAPDIFSIEIAHALSKAHRQRKLSEEQANVHLADILSTLPQLHSSVSLLPRAFELSLQTRASLYDCLYLSLSERERCSVLTADERLVNNLPGFPITLLSAL